MRAQRRTAIHVAAESLLILLAVVVFVSVVLISISGCAMSADQAAQIAAMDGCVVRAKKPESIEVFSGKAAAVAAQRTRELTVKGRDR